MADIKHKEQQRITFCHAQNAWNQSACMNIRQKVRHSKAISCQPAAASSMAADDLATTKRSARQNDTRNREPGFRKGGQGVGIGGRNSLISKIHLQPRAHKRERLPGLARQAQAQQRAVPQT